MMPRCISRVTSPASCPSSRNTSPVSASNVGGAHHSAYTQTVSTEVLEIYADMVDVELVTIDNDTKLRDLRRQLKS
ncbi:hypothetical protein [Saccharospirillum salsuginis]|uniref:Uncharacterized protein n=1 Tax=Saccharospirillum salsuginis TaxID=418750 RepID=A0A918NGH8_9GAMM|nr:hypothetical protein [Saccharospirillum salsuginis]GGX68819.1 hypothetical protein GCM10007392_40580 [Saccharospirillum salsuginis]